MTSNNFKMTNFKKIFAYSLLFFLGFYFLTSLFGGAIGFLTNKIDTASLSSETEMELSSAVWWIVAGVLVFQIAYLLSAAYLYAFTENKIWSVIYEKKTNFKSSAKLLILSIIMFLILAALVLLFGWIFLYVIDLGIVSRVIFFLIALLAGYMLYTSYISFVHTRKIFLSVKESFTKSFSNLDKTSVLLLIAGLLGIFVNIITVWLAFLPETLLLAISSVFFAAYAAWFKISLAKALKSVKF